MHLELRPAQVETGDGATLLRAMAEEIRELYGADLNGPGMPAAGATELAPPTGGFWVGYDQTGRPGCCGGLKRLPDGAVEIKRMFVIPEMRGLGVGQWLLKSLENEAKSLGYETVRLDTGDKQPVARGLYEASGYRDIENFNDHPFATYFGEKRL